MSVLVGKGPDGKDKVISATDKGELVTASLQDLADKEDPVSALLLLLLREHVALRLGMTAAGLCKRVSNNDLDSELKRLLIARG